MTSFVVSSAFLFQLASADPNSSLEQGIRHLQRENNDEAAALLKKAREEDPASSRAAFYLGVTMKRLQRYDEAKKHLNDAVTLTPRVKEALHELIEVEYQLGHLEEAKKWIATAEQEGMRPAQTAFLKGLVLSKEGDSAGSVEAFKKAKELDPSLAQSVDYQIGMTHLKENSFDDAEEAFKEVVVLDPNTDIGAYASEYLKAIERRRESEKPFHLNIGVFGEYDDNVILKPSDVSTVERIGNEGDFREVVTLNASYDHKFSETFGTRLQYDLYFANQEDLDAFDIHSHTLGLTPSWAKLIPSAVFSVPLQYNYTWVDQDNFLATFSANPLVSIQIAKSQLLQLAVKLQDKNYLRSPLTPDEDRDAFRVAPAAAWFMFFMENKGFFGLRYEYDVENTDGRNWDYDGHRVNGSLQVPLADRWKTILAMDYYAQDFDNTHTVFGVQRDDDSLTFSGTLSYALRKELELQLRYTYVNHDSNITIYEYDRNIVSAGAVVKF